MSKTYDGLNEPQNATLLRPARQPQERSGSAERKSEVEERSERADYRAGRAEDGENRKWVWIPGANSLTGDTIVLQGPYVRKGRFESKAVAGHQSQRRADREKGVK